MLQKQDFNVVEAKDGQEGYEIVVRAANSNATSTKIDLVLSDVMMANLDGIELCRKIKETPSLELVPVILCTALHDHNDRISALEAGADDFMTKPVDVPQLLARIRVAERIQELLEAPFEIEGEEIFTSGRMGIALSTTGYDRAEDALRDATLALHRVKSGTAVRHQVFDPPMHRRAHARLELETDLRWAMERDEFRVFYQPIVSLDGGEIIGVEALLRWEHPRRGLLKPAEFLTVAEETGMIIPLGSWVLERACRHMQEWREGMAEDSPLSLSVNLSVKQVLWSEVAQHVGSVLKETGLEGRLLRLEMTERAIMDDADPMLKVLGDLKDLDVSLDIDDFGIGYSSLRYLHRFPIDSLKIDRSFIANLHERRESEEIVRTILALARNIGVRVVAEGVETADEMAILKEMNCDLAQGHLFSRPLSHEEIAPFLKKNRDRQ